MGRGCWFERLGEGFDWGVGEGFWHEIEGCGCSIPMALFEAGSEVGWVFRFADKGVMMNPG